MCIVKDGVGLTMVMVIWWFSLVGKVNYTKKKKQKKKENGKDMLASEHGKMKRAILKLKDNKSLSSILQTESHHSVCIYLNYNGCVVAHSSIEMRRMTHDTDMQVSQSVLRLLTEGNVHSFRNVHRKYTTKI